MVTLQTQHQPSENAHNQYDRQTNRSLLMHSMRNPRNKPLGLRQGDKRPPREKREVANLKNNAERPPSKPVQHQAHH
jgi:hypothetical protein